MGLTNPTTLSQNASQRLTAPLAALVITQEINQAIDPDLTCSLKCSVCSENRRQVQLAEDIHAQLTPSNVSILQ